MQCVFKDIFKKAFNIVKDCPFITLYFVLYLIVLFLIIPFMVVGRNLLQTGVLGILMILLTCAFAAGWFNMIRGAFLNYREGKTQEEKIEDAVRLKDHFFSGVSEYILPVIFGGILFLVLLYGHSYLSDMIFGRLDNILGDISKFANDPNGLGNYFATLPNSTWILILKKGVFSYVVLSFITLFFLFWTASLYLNRFHSYNPVRAVWDGILGMFTRFFETLFIFIILMVVNFVLMFMQGVFLENVIMSFIAMILRIYFASYIIVLIFALYYCYETENRNKLQKTAKETPKESAVNCDNGTDGGGEDKVSD